MALYNPAQSVFFVLLSLLFCFFQSLSTSYHATFAPFTQDYSMFLKYTLLFHLCTSAQAVVPLFCNVLLLLLFPTSIPYPKSPPHWKKFTVHCSESISNIISYMELLKFLRQSHYLPWKPSSTIKKGRRMESSVYPLHIPYTWQRSFLTPNLDCEMHPSAFKKML